MKTTLSAALLLSASLCGLVGCDSQVDPGYEGEPLFALRGTVVIENPDAPKELVPALLYASPLQDQQSLVVEEVSFEGTFPANIELKFYSPPPEGTFLYVGKLNGLTPQQAAAAGDPELAFGAITAVRPGTDRVLLRDNGFAVEDSCPLSWEEPTPDVPCTLHQARCPKDFDVSSTIDPDGVCFHEVSECDPTARDAYQRLSSCTIVESYGNAEYSKSITQNFAGLSRDVAVIYLKTAAAAGSITSLLFNRGAEIAAGYGLLRGHPFSAEEMESSRLCYLDILEEMVARENGEHPSLTDGERNAGMLDTYREIVAMMESRGCSLAVTRRSDFETVNFVGDERIEIRISSDAGVDPSRIFGGPPV